MRIVASCFRAFKLMLLFYPGGAAIFPYAGWTFLPLGIFTLNPVGLLAMTAIALLCFAAGLLWFAGLNLIYSLLLRLLWSKPPGWSRVTHSRRDLLLSYGIGMLSCIPASILLAAAVAGDAANFWELDYWRGEFSIAAEILIRCGWLWFAIAALLYRSIGHPKGVAHNFPP